MNSFVLLFLAATTVAVSGGIIAVPSSRILQGPSTRTTIVGPDGSSISAYAPGGQIILSDTDTPALNVQAAPVVYAAPAVVAAPAPIHAGVIVDDLEGQYVPDNTEALYDDGSYKTDIYGF